MRLDEAARGSRQSGGQAPIQSGVVWRTQRAGFTSALRLAMLRAAHSRWLLLVVALGILVADVLICTVPLYNTLVSDVQLQNAITSSDSLQRNMQIAVRSTTINRAVSQHVSDEVQILANDYLTSFSAPRPTSYVTAGLMTLAQAGGHTFGTLGDLAEARMEAFDYSALLPYLRFTAGRAPASTAPGKPIQVMVTQDMAGFLHLKVGQTLVVTNLGASGSGVTGVITGIFEPINANDPFWNGLTFATEGGDTSPVIYPILTSMDGFYSAFSSFSDADMTQNVIYYADSSRITTDNMGAVANDVLTFRSHASGEVQSIPGVDNVLLQGSLEQIIAGVQTELSLIALPLYVIAAQIVGLALLFVAAMAALLIEYQSQGIATLKSRGTSGTQLLGIFSIQSALLGLLAVVVGPFLATGLAVLLIHWFLPSGSSPSMRVGAAYFSGAASPTAVIIPAIIGGLLGVAVVTMTALQAARLDVLAFRREMARPSHKPFWRRAYLDIGLALLCAVGYLELGQFGGTQQRLALGSQGNSPLLLMTPALLLLAGGLLLLRLIPLAASLGARLASRGRGLTTLMAFAQIERTPGRYSRMTLLLVLAVGLGLFALTFDASLTQSVQDRTSYAAGADVRLMLNSQVAKQKVGGYLAHLKTLPGVEAATPLYRTYGSTSVDLGNLPVDILGVDSTSFAPVANARSWRSDYASQSLLSLMAQLQAHRASSADTALHPMWSVVSASFAQQLHLQVGDRYQINLSDTPFSTPSFVVGAIVQEFPTLYPGRAPGGFIVLDLHDLDNTITAASEPGVVIGPNEFWLRTSANTAQHTALLHTLNREQFDLSINTTDSYREDLQQAQSNPINGGMRGLLLIGAITAALLAVLGTLVQALLAARQRTTQFAILRTLGMAGRQLTGLLLGEQAVVYLFGLFGGTALGLILTTATWPFLTFSDAAVDPTTIGVPSYVLRVDWPMVGLFYGALILAFALALLLASRYAATIGLGKALRLGED